MDAGLECAADSFTEEKFGFDLASRHACLHNSRVISAAAGFIAGLVHVFSGPDHLAAVAPMAAAERRRAGWIAGARWGAGHAAGVMLVGILLILFREVLPLQQISAWSERIVGLALVLVGLWGMRLAFSSRLHAHTHTHGDTAHVHIHCHKHPHKEHVPHVHSHAAFGIGTLHGLAGSSHVYGVLPALAFTTHLSAVVYLLTYALGTMAGMSLFSSATHWAGKRAIAYGPGGYRMAMVVLSLFSLGVGAWWCAGFSL